MTYEEIIQFHGHECPGLGMGYRMATAAMNKLDSIRAEDEEIVAMLRMMHAVLMLCSVLLAAHLVRGI